MRSREKLTVIVGSTASTELLGLPGKALWSSPGALEAALACALGCADAADGWADPYGSSGERWRCSGESVWAVASQRLAGRLWGGSPLPTSISTTGAQLS